jgi:hypothetical protein
LVQLPWTNFRKCRKIYLCDVRHVCKQKWSFSTPVIKHSKFVFSFDSILINVCMYGN